MTSTNYNGQLLLIGRNFQMTATSPLTASTTGWTGSSTTNSPTLIFTMASNLVFTANFADTNPPTFSLTNLIAGQHVSNNVFVVQGKASDNWLVTGVTYQLNNSGWPQCHTRQCGG